MAGSHGLNLRSHVEKNTKKLRLENFSADIRPTPPVKNTETNTTGKRPAAENWMGKRPAAENWMGKQSVCSASRCPGQIVDQGQSTLKMRLW